MEAGRRSGILLANSDQSLVLWLFCFVLRLFCISLVFLYCRIGVEYGRRSGTDSDKNYQELRRCCGVWQEALTEDGCDKVDHINQREHRDRRDNREHMEHRSSTMRRSTESPEAFLEPIANQNTYSPDLFLQFDAKSQSRERMPGTEMPG